MCFPYGGPAEIPLLSASQFYNWRKWLGFWLRTLAILHTLLSLSWFVCFQVIMGAADLIFSQFGLWSVSAESHNVYLLAFYFGACVIQAVFSAIFVIMRLAGVPWRPLIALSAWQYQMEFILLCIAFFVYLTAACLAFLTLIAAMRDEMAIEEAIKKQGPFMRSTFFDPFGSRAQPAAPAPPNPGPEEPSDSETAQLIDEENKS